jgi:hypothetical protein
MRVATIQFAPGQDPADVAKDPEKLKQILNNRRSLVSVAMEQFARTGHDQEASLQELLPIIKSVTNVVEQGQLIQEVATTLHVPEATILKLVQQTTVVPGTSVEADLVDGEFHLNMELAFLGLLIQSPQARGELFGHLQAEIFLDRSARELYKVIQTLAQERNDFSTMPSDVLVTYLPPQAEAVRVVAHDFLTNATNDAVSEARAWWRTLYRRFLERRLAHMHQQLQQAEAGTKEEQLKQFQVLAEELEAVKTRSPLVS